MFILYEIIQVTLIITWSRRVLLTLIIPLKQAQYKVPAFVGPGKWCYMQNIPGACRAVEGNESVQQ